MNKNRQQDFVEGFLHPKNLDDEFQYFVSLKKLQNNDRAQFKQFMEYIANLNNQKKITVDQANKFVETKFTDLWNTWKNNTAAKGNAGAKEGYATPAPRSRHNAVIANYQSGGEPQGRRRRPKENYLPPNEDEYAHNFMNEGVKYEYTGATPDTTIDYNKTQVPYNYNTIFNKNTTGEVTDATAFNQGSGFAKLSEEKNDIYGGVPLNRPGTSMHDPQASPLATDGSRHGVVDANVSFANTAKDNKIPKKYILKIDSRLRNVSLSKRSSSYRISLYDQVGAEYGFIRSINGLTNIISIELKQATLPNIIRDSTLQFYEPYVFMDITGVEGDVCTSNATPSKVFAELYYNNSDTIKDTPHLTMIPSSSKKEYRPDNPLNNLKNIEITFYNFDGEVFDFGDDAPAIKSITLGYPTIVQTQNPHGILTGDRVYLRGINTGNNGYNAIINQPKGWIVAVNTIDTFSIDYDTSLFPPVIAFGNALIAKLQNNVTLEIYAYTTDTN